MSDLDDLRKKVVEFRDARDWKQFHNPKDMAISLVLEATELLEQFQWKSSAEVAKHLENHKEEVEDELGDILYCILLIANDLEIDVSEALLQKLAKSAVKYPVEKSKGRHTKYTEL